LRAIASRRQLESFIASFWQAVAADCCRQLADVAHHRRHEAVEIPGLVMFYRPDLAAV